MIINKDTKLFVEKGGLPGVKRVAGKLAEDLGAKYPSADVELQFGGQPIYSYIISVE